MNLKPIVLATLLAASTLVVTTPVAALGPCPSGVNVTGFTESTAAPDNHAHYQVGAGHTVRLQVTGSEKDLNFTTATTMESGRAHYTFNVPFGSAGIEAADSAQAHVETEDHAGRSPARLGSDAIGCTLFLSSVQWDNEPPQLAISFDPLTALDDDDLSANVDFEDPNGDAMASIQWAWLSCTPDPGEGINCDVPEDFVGGSPTEPVLGPTSPFEIPTAIPASQTTPGDHWRLQVTLVDEHGTADGGSAFHEETLRIAEPGDIPNATFAIRTVDGDVDVTGGKVALGTELAFDAAGSTDGPNDPVTDPSDLEMRWDFDGDGLLDAPNGTFSTANQIVPSRTYATRGAFAPTVQVRDLEGFVSSATHDLFVNRLPNATVSLGTVTHEGPAVANVSLADPDNEDAVAGNDETAPLAYDFVWQSLGAGCLEPATDISSGSGTDPGAPFDLVLPEASVPEEGLCLRLQVEPSDSLETGAPASFSVTVGNAPPSLEGASLPAVTSAGPLVLNLTVLDPDGGDAPDCSVTFQRLAGGVPVENHTVDPAGCPDPITLSDEVAGLDRNETWAAVVTVADEAASDSATVGPVVVGNDPPVVGAANLPDGIDTTQVVATVDDVPGEPAGTKTLDEDGDAVSCFAEFLEDGATPTLIARVPESGTAACNQFGLDAGVAPKGTAVFVRITPVDATGAAGTPATSAVRTIGNARPSVDSVTLAGSGAGAPQAGDQLVVSYTVGDPDGADVAGLDCLVTVQSDDAVPVLETLDPADCTSPLATTGLALQRGQTFTATVTVEDVDGDTDERTSGNLTVVNAPPAATVLLRGLEEVGNQAFVGDELVANVTAEDADGDPLTCALFLFFEDAEEPVDTIPDEGGYDCTGSATEAFTHNETQLGELWIAVLLVDDGFVDEPVNATSYVLIGNHAPVVNVTELTLVDDALVTTVDASDEDGDAMQCTFTWRRNGTVVRTHTSSCGPQGSDTVPAALVHKGSWNVTVVADAGLGGVSVPDVEATTVPNRPPAGSVTVTPASPTTASTLTAAPAVTDADNDTLVLGYQWQKRIGAAPFANVAGQTASTVAPALTAKGEDWRVVVTASDGDAAPVTLASAAVHVANSPPAATIGVGPASPRTADDLVATLSASDADNDTVTTGLRWQVSTGGPFSDAAGATSLTLPANFTTEGESWRLVATLNDTEASATFTSPVLLVGNTAPAGTLAVAPAAPTSGQALSALDTVSDPDPADTLARAYQWQRRAVGDSLFQDVVGQTAATLPSGVTLRGEQWKVRLNVTGDEEGPVVLTSPAVTVLNSPPAVTGVLLLNGNSPTPSAPIGKGVPLRVAWNAPTDADGAGDVASCLVQLLRSGNATPAASATLAGATCVSTPQHTFTGAGQVRGETWFARVRAFDVPGLNATADSDLEPIVDTPPTGVITVTPSFARDGDNLVASLTTSDADGDERTCRYQWSKPGTARPALEGQDCDPSGSDTLPASATSPGDVWTFAVTISAGGVNVSRSAAIAVVVDTDNDGIADVADNCPAAANPDQANLDLDAAGDACDPDRDGDLRANASDNCPSAANPDQADADGDRLGDFCDPTPLGGDPDQDGRLDSQDNCPTTANAGQDDLDGDGKGDACDADDDGDGTPDTSDAFPRSAGESDDTDRDGIGDNADPDDDNDGTPDATDNCPQEANAGQADLDGDGKGDACDPDRDGDGVPDASDKFPDDGTETRDADNDGAGDTADPDDDNDGATDAEERAAGTSPTDSDSDNDGLTDGEELSSGSDPLDPDSPSIQPVAVRVRLAGGHPRVSWTSPLDARIKDFLVFRGEPPVQVATVPYVHGQTSYVFVDTEFPGGTQTYFVQPRLAGQGSVGFESSLAVASSPFSLPAPCEGDDCGGQPPQGSGTDWVPIVVILVIVLVVAVAVVGVLAWRKARGNRPGPAATAAPAGDETPM